MQSPAPGQEEPLAVVQDTGWGLTGWGTTLWNALGLWDDSKLSRSLQCALTATKAKSIRDYIKGSTANRHREAINPLTLH